MTNLEHSLENNHITSTGGACIVYNWRKKAVEGFLRELDPGLQDFFANYQYSLPDFSKGVKNIFDKYAKYNVGRDDRNVAAAAPVT